MVICVSVHSAHLLQHRQLTSIKHLSKEHEEEPRGGSQESPERVHTQARRNREKRRVEGSTGEVTDGVADAAT